MKISHILQESPQLCPECGGPAFGDLLLAEKKDACYSKVRSRYKVWPSAYASGALVQCRKKGAANWGNKNESADDNFGKSAALMTASPEALKTAQDIVQKQADKNVIGQAKIAGAVPDQGVAEGSVNDYFKRRKDEEDRIAGTKAPAKRTPQQTDYAKRRAQDKKSSEGVTEGSNDTIYPNAEVIKSKNGKPVGEIYQDGNSWGAFHYRADRGYDFIDSREDAIEALRDLHQETGRSRPDYTIKGVAEGSETEGTATLAKIAAAGDNGYDMIEDGLNGLLGTEAQIMLQDMYDDVSREHRLHPDDDFEQIYDRMMDRIESDYGQTGMAEGSFGSGYGSLFTLYVNTGENPATKTKTKKFKREDDAVLWAEDYADQHEMFPNLKMEIQDENGNVVWELEESQGVAEGNNEKIAGRHDPEEFDAMVGRLRQLAGAGPLKTVWDEKKRVYRNVPTAQQPNKGSQSNA